MIGSNLSIFVDSRIPCRVHLVCRERKLTWLKETTFTGITDLPVRIANTSRRIGALRIATGSGMCRSKPVGIIRSKRSRFYFAIDYVYVFKTRTAKRKKTSQESVVFHDEFVHASHMHVVQCYSITCKRRHH